MSAEVIFEEVRNDEYERDKACEEILKQYKSKYGDNMVYLLKNDNVLGLYDWKVLGKDVTVIISKTGPCFLSPDECSMSIYYYSQRLKDLKEKAIIKHSNDI